MSSGQTSRPRRSPWSGGDRLFALALAGVLLLSLGSPLIGAAWGLLQPPPAQATTTLPAFTWGSLARTIAYASLIGALATLLALPVGWALRARADVWRALVLTPLLMPNYLAYAGWGVLRGPGSILGDWLARQGGQTGAWVDWGLAIFGLALWTWPIAAIAIMNSAESVGDELIELARLEPASRLRRAWELTRLVKGGMIVGFAGALCLCIGSAVPLHLAQVQTLAIHLWTYMSLTPQPVRAWSGGWVLVLAAALAGLVLAQSLPTRSLASSPDRGTARARIRGGVVLLGAVIWSASTLGPLMIQALSLHSPRAIVVLWNSISGALFASLQTGAWVGAIGGAICLCTWRLASTPADFRPSWPVRLTIALLGFGAVLPGVLIGSGIASLVNASWCPEWLGRTNIPLIAAHVARFGIVGGLVGLWLAGLESTDHRAARLMVDSGVRGWWVTGVLPSLPPVLGVVLATGALSMHEIETAVQLVPPGPGNLAQRLLDLLHYAKDEQLAAASVMLLGSGTLLVLVASWLLTGARRGTGGDLE